MRSKVIKYAKIIKLRRAGESQVATTSRLETDRKRHAQIDDVKSVVQCDARLASLWVRRTCVRKGESFDARVTRLGFISYSASPRKLECMS